MCQPGRHLPRSAQGPAPLAERPPRRRPRPAPPPPPTCRPPPPRPPPPEEKGVAPPHRPPTSPATGGCSRPKPRWTRWLTSCGGERGQGAGAGPEAVGAGRPGGRPAGRRLPVRDQRRQAEAQVLVEEPQDDDYPGGDMRHHPDHYHCLLQHLMDPRKPKPPPSLPPKELRPGEARGAATPPPPMMSAISSSLPPLLPRAPPWHVCVCCGACGRPV
ncbi:unnamed protein product [Eretmochelys imbricata]